MRNLAMYIYSFYVFCQFSMLRNNVFFGLGVGDKCIGKVIVEDVNYREM